MTVDGREATTSKVVRRFEKVPPEAFRNLVVSKGNELFGVFDLKFEGPVLCASKLPMTYSREYAMLKHMVEHMYLAYTAALGPPKPWGLTHSPLVFPKRDGEPFFDRIETEWFVTRNEAVERRERILVSIRNRSITLVRARPHLHDLVTSLAVSVDPKIEIYVDRMVHF